MEASEMAQQLRVLIALVKDLSTPIVAPNCNYTSRGYSTLLGLREHQGHTCAHNYM